jgi:[ribosomal protein S5]-alanine N-acetyltransferase
MAIRMHATHPSTGCHTINDAISRTAAPATVSSDWRQQLPVLASDGVMLRQLKQSDAATLFMLLTTEEVARFITPPPTTVAGFEQFIAWAIDRQRQGKVAFFAVTVRGSDAPIGLFQVRVLDGDFTTAEWGFAIGSPYWGTGLFPQGAGLTLEFAFETLGVERMEARSMVANARGNAALRKVGATPEGLLRQSFEKNGRRHDQYLWSILAEEWRDSRGVLVPARGTDVVTELAHDTTDDAPGAALWADARRTILVRVH